MKKMRNGVACAMALSLAVTSIAFSTEEAKAATTTYTVKSGDTMWGIAKKYKVSVNDIKEWNNLKTNTVKIGQKLIVSSSSKEVVHTVKKGETLFSIAKKYDVSTKEIKKWNKLKNDTIAIGQKLKIETEVKTSTAPNTNTSSSATTGTVTASELNVRASASTSAKIAGTLKKGATVTITDTKKGWYEIKSGSLKGWVSATYIQKKTTSNNNTTSGGNTSSSATTGTVTASELNVRASASTSAKIAGTLKKGATVTITDTKTGWYEIKSGSLKGWVSATYIQKKATSNNTNNGNDVSEVKYGVVTADVLNVRDTASTNGDVISKVYVNTKLTITDEKSGWYKIKYGNVTGWVSSDYVKETNNSTKPQENEVETMKVNATSLNMRSSNSTSASIVTTIPYGSLVYVSKESGNWSYVTYGNKKGWVSSEYLEKPSSGGTATGSPKHKTIIVDPGHGGTDPGAISAYDNTYEKTVVLATGLKLRSALQAQGYTVKMTRTNDLGCLQAVGYGTNDLNCRTSYANANSGDLFISLHANQAVQGVNGTETYYSATGPQVSNSQRLANAVHSRYQPVFGSNNRGVKTANYYVIKYTNAPSILLEIGFLNGLSDLNKLKSSSMQQNVANAIAKGVNDYYGY